jgi:D-beta-D-heptose 7-phosphate kinase/D-beta-D-heptose 1-phosphate adenosyltransferase
MDRCRAVEIIEDFSRAKVFVIGDIMVDHFIWGKVARISPEAPVPVVEVARENLLLGGSANVLNNIVSVGGKVAVAGIIGPDDMGQWLIHELRKMNVDTAGIVVEAGRPTTVKTRIIAHHQQVVRFDRESKKPVSSESLLTIAEYLKSIRNDLGAIVISDYNKGIVSEPLLNKIKEVVAGNNIVTCVDPKRSDFSIYHGFDVITPNHHEVGHALGIEDFNGYTRKKDKIIRESVRHLIDQLRLKALLVTRGEEGMSLYKKNGKVAHIPTVAKEVFDVTGAGDTVIGVFALCVASGATFEEAAVLANHAAGIVVGKVGTATVSQEELKRIL